MVVAMSSIRLDHAWPSVEKDAVCEGPSITIESAVAHSSASSSSCAAELRTLSEAHVVELSGDEVFDMYTGDDHTVTEDEDEDYSIKEDIVPFDFLGEDDVNDGSPSLPVFGDGIEVEGFADHQILEDSAVRVPVTPEAPRRVSLCAGQDALPAHYAPPHGVTFVAPTPPRFLYCAPPPLAHPMAHTHLSCAAPHGGSSTAFRDLQPGEYRIALQQYAETMKRSEYSRRQVILGRRRLKQLYAARLGRDDLLSGEPWGRSLDYQMARRELVSDIYARLLKGLGAASY